MTQAYRPLSSLALVLISCCSASCRNPIGVRRAGYEEVYRRMNASVLNEGRLSLDSTAFLSFFGLEELYEKDPEAAIVELHDLAMKPGRRNALVVLSELSYLSASRTEQRKTYLAAAIYAYAFLFAEIPDDPLTPFDRRFRFACDLYNRALARALTPRVGAAIELFSGTLEYPFGTIEISVDRSSFPWEEAEFVEFLPADAFMVRGLSFRIRDPGLGVPLIGVRNSAFEKDRRDFVPENVKVPAVVFLRIEGGSIDGPLRGVLELYSGFGSPQVDVGGQTVPLETDLSAPLAYSLETGKLFDFALRGFFSGEDSGHEEDNGIFMLSPYEPGKIPVVFVHGTASSPAFWAPMFNGLLADRTLRKKFQFWFFIYRTGNPIAYSASLLRNSLDEVLEVLDPRGNDAALRRMVVVGHSQGGLLAKMTAIRPGTRLWDAAFEKGLEELDLEPEQEALLEDCLMFELLPYVERVIFISTPHRGSYAASGWIARLFARNINVRRELRRLGKRLFEQGLFPEGTGIPTSVENMDPENRFILALSEIPVDPDVRAHSIIPVRGDGPLEEQDDGVVEYSSASIEEADSEFVLKAGHSCQSQPEAIREVRRILLLHLGLTEGDGGAQATDG